MQSQRQWLGDSEDWPPQMSDIVNNSPIQDYVLYPDDHAQPT